MHWMSLVIATGCKFHLNGKPWGYSFCGANLAVLLPHGTRRSTRPTHTIAHRARCYRIVDRNIEEHPAYIPIGSIYHLVWIGLLSPAWLEPTGSPEVRLSRDKSGFSVCLDAFHNALHCCDYGDPAVTGPPTALPLHPGAGQLFLMLQQPSPRNHTTSQHNYGPTIELHSQTKCTFEAVVGQENHGDWVDSFIDGDLLGQMILRNEVG
ncbi:hypothetical protein L210DRAFT_3634536 [Boletus edulis BED1]|uniref:Uncharacterized protein n=1 Tax=Boletus edulis BED1 TaxID=1328754 RepID=A0AAD4G884_BOLED|nr:hypothetical protein L210DRAFT_3634536 [Boletus edulis BED1]